MIKLLISSIHIKNNNYILLIIQNWWYNIILIYFKSVLILRYTNKGNDLSSNPALWGWRKKTNECIFEFIVDYESFRKSNMKEKNLDSVYKGKIIEIHNPNIK